jgi:hypothetical protein
MLPKIPARWLLLTLFLVVTLFAGCSGGGGEGQASGQDLAPMDSMPAEVRSAPTNVQQAYQFAVANPDLIQQFPCYCGCGKMGHTSNYSCYVAGEGSDGIIQYDTHALGCSICVDITQDVMRLTQDGKPIAEIQSYIDNTYSQYGPSNMPAASPAQ